ncbi:MAG: aminoglycoside phosphotransferase family protein, partial [Patescibacteria group bacterium]|nr:aminoglycoside phosphotransferase family protein [Patescibacteria group bacterium]
EILEVGNEAAEFPFMIVERGAGQPALSFADRKRMVRQMGRLTAKINEIETSGYGHVFDWSSNQLSKNDTWKDYLEKELKLDERLAALERHKLLDEERMADLRRECRELSDWSYKPHLCHADMRFKNVLVDDSGKVCLVLDWESCMSNIAPQWDLCVALDDLSLDEKEIFLEGYGLSPQEYRRIAPGVKALNIINYAEFVENAAALKNDDKRKKAFDMMRSRLRGALDLYSL